MQHQLTGIPQWQIAQYWDRIAALLEPVLARSEVDNTMEDVHQFLLKGNMQAWHVDWRMIVVTAVQPFGVDANKPTRMVCQVVYCAGEGMEEWLPDAMAQMKVWAKGMRCDRVRISGRRGWVKVLPDFHETCVTVECEI